ncbi:MAG: hypothetical protein ACYTG1_11865 [Planctomycetota bacterium]|jgi:hypothetical protein
MRPDAEDDGWSPGRGLARATVRVLVRGAVSFVVLGGLLWLVTPALNALPAHWSQFALVAAVMTVPGFALGAALSRGLTEIAGFVSVVLTAVALAATWAVVVGVTAAARLLRPLGDWQELLVPGAVALIATIVVVRNTLLEPE